MGKENETTPRSRSLSGWGAVGAGTLLANVIAYALFLVLNRELGADDLGAVASLLNLVIIAGVAALSTQLVSAWRVALHRPDAHATALRTGAIVGLIVSAVVALVSPLLAPLLHLDGPLPVLLVAASILPTCVTAGVQGILQGSERFVALGIVYALTSITRTAGGAFAAWAGWGVTGVMALTTVAAWFMALVAVVLVLGHLRRTMHPDVPTQVRRVLAGMAGTSALLVASTIDTPVARHVLSGADSGAYAVLSLFAKAAFWGPAFLATVLFPHMSRAKGLRPLFLALGGTATIVGVGVAFSAALSGPLVRVVGGTAYTQLASLVPAFTALGGAWALAQVLVFWGAARGRHVVGYLVWAAVGVATAVVILWRHDSVAEVATTFLVASLAVAIVGLAFSVPRGRGRRSQASTDRPSDSGPRLSLRPR